jgi:hypothetical protein
MRRLTEIKKNFYTTLYSFPLLSQLLLALRGSEVFLMAV